MAHNLATELGLEPLRSAEVYELLDSGAPMDRRLVAYRRVVELEEAFVDAEDALEVAKANALRDETAGAPVEAGDVLEVAKSNAANVAQRAMGRSMTSLQSAGRPDQSAEPRPTPRQSWPSACTRSQARPRGKR